MLDGIFTVTEGTVTVLHHCCVWTPFWICNFLLRYRSSLVLMSLALVHRHIRPHGSRHSVWKEKRYDACGIFVFAAPTGFSASAIKAAQLFDVGPRLQLQEPRWVKTRLVPAAGSHPCVLAHPPPLSCN